jgi:iron complex outermembrane receptor protein
MRKLPLLFASTMLFAAPAFAQDASSSTATPQAADAGQDSGDIVVTAQRRASSLQKTPIAVTALDSTALKDLQINRTSDLQRVTPSLSVSQGTVDPTTLTVFMRGAGQNAGTWVGYESAVGLYIDDLYFGSLTGANLDLADLERIEVLRGPQGTLYGRNTLTGAIKYVTKKPTDTPFGDFELEGGEKSMVRAKGTVSMPIAKDWAMLVSGSYYHRDGLYNAPQLDTNSYGFETDYGARAAIAYTGGGPLTLNASAFFAKSKNNGSVGLATNPTTLAPADANPYTYLSPVDGYGRSKTYGGDFTVGYDIGDGVTLKSITGVIHTTEDFLADTTAGQPTSRVGGPYPLGFDRLQSSAAATQFSEELQMLADWGKLHYIGGLYYFQSIGHQDRQDLLLGIYNTLPQHVHLETKSYAGYAQFTGDLTSTLSLVGGIRFTHEVKSALGQT